jgi:hypothetical protein
MKDIVEGRKNEEAYSAFLNIFFHVQPRRRCGIDALPRQGLTPIPRSTKAYAPSAMRHLPYCCWKTVTIDG